MSTYTTVGYFASELVLLVMVAFNAHIRCAVSEASQHIMPPAVLVRQHISLLHASAQLCHAVGANKQQSMQHGPWCRLKLPVAVLAVHAAFHVLYTGRG